MGLNNSMLSTLFRKYNQPNSLLVFSSYANTSESMKNMNALAWYTKHLLSSFPKNKKVIFLAEKIPGYPSFPYEDGERILVIPCWQKGSVLSIGSVVKTLWTFSQPKKILFQFEFNIFGSLLGPLITLFLISYIKFLHKKIYFQIHQIVLDITTLKDQVNISNTSVIRFFNLSLRIFYRTIFFLSERIIVTEEALAMRLRTVASARKLVILHHHVLEEKEALNTVPSESTKVKTLLFFGYLSWYKGVDWLVESFREVRKKNPELRLIIAGGESPTLKNKPHYKKFYKNLVSSIKEVKGITHTGFVSDEEAKKLFLKADLLVMPYRAFISSSGPLSWALAFKKPVIFSNKLKEYTQSGDFAAAMKQAHITENDLFFDLNAESLSKTLENLDVKKAANFSTLLAQRRSQKNITKLLYKIMYPTEAVATNTAPVPLKLKAVLPLNYAK